MRKSHFFVKVISVALCMFFRCGENPTGGTGKVPEVTTTEIGDITDTTARCGGTVTSDNEAVVTARGVCWSTDQNPTIADDTTHDSTGVGRFTSKITGLTPETTYYVRSYATNREGTGYGSSVSFTTLPSGTVTDIDGNRYKTITIGDQLWMAENLKVTHYRNGDPIPNITFGFNWIYLTTGAYCHYFNNESYTSTYGCLYNWYAVNDSRNIAPEGWHIPTDEEWKELEMFLGMSQSKADDIGWRGTNEGGKLKETGSDHWLNPNTGATNESGFTALPGGYRLADGFFGGIESDALFWSSTEFSSLDGWYRALNFSRSGVNRTYGIGKRGGLSIRCIKD